MAEVLIILKIMPKGIEVNLKDMEEKTKEKIVSFGADIVRAEQEPVAFGLVSLKIEFVMDENKGDTEPLEDSIKSLDEVASVDVIGVSRTLG